MSDPLSEFDQSASYADAIEALAQQTNRPVAEVRRIFEVEFARLRRDARVTDYLVLFASRRARESLAGRTI